MGFETSARILTLEDRESILDLAKIHSKISREKTSSDFMDKFKSDLDMLFLNSENTHYQILGSFNEKGSLMAILAQVFWDREPLWFASLYMARPSGFFDPLKNGTTAVMKLALAEGERHEKFRLMILRNQNWPFDRYFNRLHQAIPEYGRYHRYIEAVIPKGTKPLSWWAWNMMGERPWQSDLYIEHLILKQEFRPPALQIGVNTAHPNY